MNDKHPIPVNEIDRITQLAAYDVDYINLRDSFNDLCRLASHVAGINISLVNLLDATTQWTVSSYGLIASQVPREESVCQYTIMTDEALEISDLSNDPRFKDKYYVTGEPYLKYYYGVPLKTESSLNVGTLCLVDTEIKALSREKEEFLAIIASEIVNRLKAYKVISNLKNEISHIEDKRKRIAHDIRGPLAGIIGLTEIIVEQDDTNKIEEVLEFTNLINKSCNSILELANEILTSGVEEERVSEGLRNDLNLLLLKEKLEMLYAPQAVNKNIKLTISANSETGVVPFSKNKLLQIAGNLISNAIKFTADGGTVSVALDLKIGTHINSLIIRVEDTGVGITNENIEILLKGQSKSTNGTGGEKGYGFGLALVKYLVESLRGEIDIKSKIGRGSSFEIRLPQSKC